MRMVRPGFQGMGTGVMGLGFEIMCHNILVEIFPSIIAKHLERDACWELAIKCYHQLSLVKDSGEKITRDDRGRLLLNGKLMSDAAVEQRLRRWCTKKKNGGLKCSQDVYERYHNQGPDARLELIQIFKDAFLNKEPLQQLHLRTILKLKV